MELKLKPLKLFSKTITATQFNPIRVLTEIQNRINKLDEQCILLQEPFSETMKHVSDPNRKLNTGKKSLHLQQYLYNMFSPVTSDSLFRSG